jgi:hypothetical protein
MKSIPYPLVDQAWDTYRDDPAEGARLARLALNENPAEIDAFVILALCSPCSPERIALLREGMRLGEATHAAKLAEPDDHSFWSDVFTRPYMRSVHNLALDLWRTETQAGRLEAVRLAKHLVAINPADNQGIRFLLMHWLPTLGRWTALEGLLRQIGDDGRTETAYTRALAAYRLQQSDADDLLDVAIGINDNVPAMIKGRRPAMPKGEHVTYRSRDEAAAYAHHMHDVWASVPGARGWIARATD